MHRFTLAAVAATLAFAGCGGGDEDSNQALSYAEFGEATSEVCNDQKAEIDSISRELTGEAKADEAVLDEYVPAVKTYIEDLQALEAPAELEESVTTRNATANELYAILEEQQELAAAGDQKAYADFVKAKAPDINALASAAAEATSKLGAGDCL